MKFQMISPQPLAICREMIPKIEPRMLRLNRFVSLETAFYEQGNAVLFEVGVTQYFAHIGITGSLSVLDENRTLVTGSSFVSTPTKHYFLLPFAFGGSCIICSYFPSGEPENILFGILFILSGCLGYFLRTNFIHRDLVFSLQKALHVENIS